MNRKFLPALTGTALFVIYSLVMLLIIRNFDKSFMVGFLFSVLALVLTAVVTIRLYDIPEGADHTFFGLHITILGILYLLLTFGINILFTSKQFNAYVEAALDLILVVLYIWPSFTVVFAKQHVASIQSNDYQKNQYIKWLEFTVQTAADQSPDQEVKKRLRKLAEDVHFQDPQSDPALQSVENKLADAADALLAAVQANQPGEVDRITREMKLMLSERARLVKLMK